MIVVPLCEKMRLPQYLQCNGHTIGPLVVMMAGIGMDTRVWATDEATNRRAQVDVRVPVERLMEAADLGIPIDALYWSAAAEMLAHLFLM